MKRVLFNFALVLIVSFSCSHLLFSQHGVELGQLERAFSNASVLMALSAHPDDEDGATLAYYRMKFGVKTYSVFFTRGEGGQNEIGPELYKELGVIRTRETEEAAAILGSDVYFLNFIDFGYSKTATETFEKWGGRGAVLERLVYIVRKLKPDVIIMNHNPIDGHGNHQVVAIAAIEAFDAASDPTFAPDQLHEEGVDLWQPKKLFWRAQRFTGERREPVDVVNTIGERDSLRQKSYQEIALAAFSQHKSQGMDRFAMGREVSPTAKTFYRLIRSSSRFASDSTSFFGGIDALREDSSLAYVSSRLRGLLRAAGDEDFLKRLNETISDPKLSPYVDQLAGENTASSLQNTSVVGRRTLEIWNGALQRLAALKLDLSIEPVASDTVVVPGQQFTVSVGNVSPKRLRSRLAYQLRVPNAWTVEQASARFTVTVPRTERPTLPLVDGLYNEYHSAPRLWIVATLADVPRFRVNVPVRLSIAPHQTLVVQPKASRRKDAGNEFQFTVHNYFNNKTAGRIDVILPPGWSASTADFVIDKEDGESSGRIILFPPAHAAAGDDRIVFRAHGATDTVLVKRFDVQVHHDVQVGIIKSYDNTVETAVQELGAKYKLLDEKDLQGDLQKFTSIIVDIRAYLVREDLKKNNAHLLEYVKNGGNLIVLYQKDFEWKSEYAPYPLKISRERVVDETAPVRILVPDHPLFNAPNKIKKDDWDGWVQERGLYFPSEYSKEYAELLASNDPDEMPLRGGYLIANYGKGTYIYTSYVWYRQWKEVHPGALRNLANMICLPFFRASQ
jgi:LmbE family N-acetylglucosaminyl deacetylase